MSLALELKNLFVSLREFRLEDIDLEVNNGEYVAIIGPTGSGKSVLLETIVGFYKPTRGKIFIEGRDVTLLPPERREVGIVYQDYALFPHMNAFKNIAYGLRKRGLSNKEIRREVERIAKVLKIEHLLHRKPETLSGGEQQRVAIARALVIKPKLLLLDEPLSALDVKMREDLRELIKEATKEYNATVLHVTHDFEDVFNLASKVVVMRRGRILQIEKPNDIFSKPTSDFIATFVGANVFRGVINSKKDGLTAIKVGDHILWSKDHAEVGEHVKIAIRPESIIISDKPPKNLDRNVIPCSVGEVKRSANLIWFTLNAKGLKIKAAATPNFLGFLNINFRRKVFAIFEAENVKIIDRNRQDS